jgi:hypothetical protein
MLIIKLISAIIIPLLLGVFGISALLRERLSFFAYLERLAIAFAVGIWMLIFIMFCLPFLRIALSFQNIFLTACITLIGLAPFSLKHLSHFLPGSLPNRKGFWVYALLILIIIKTLFVFWSALLKPIIGPDLLTCYALAAKHTFIHQAPVYLYHEPPLPFLIESWTPITLGAWNDALLSLFFPLMFISLIVIFFSSLKRYFADSYSMLFTFLLASIPLLLFHAGTAYADFPQAFYYSTATIYLFQFIKELKDPKNRAYSCLLVGLILLGISVWVKKSGLYYAGINLSVLALFVVCQWKNVQKKNIFYAFLLFVIITCPWLAYDRITILTGALGEAIPALQNAAASPVLFMRDMSWVVIFVTLRNMFLEGNWQLLWILFFSLLILYPGKAFRFPHAYLAAILILQLAALFMLYRFTNAFPNIVNDTQLNRLTLHFVPVVLYFCAELIASARETRLPPANPEA